MRPILALLAFLSAGVYAAIDCSGGGRYAPTNAADCALCPAGHMCPVSEGSILQASLDRLKCGVGQYQPLKGQTSCLTCPRDTACPGRGTIQFLACNTTAGETSEPGSQSCSACGSPDFFKPPNGTCRAKTVCKPTQFEDVTGSTAASQPGDRACKDLTPFKVVKYRDVHGPEDPWCVQGSVKALRCTDVLLSYIMTYPTPTSDLVAWTWAPCPDGQFVLEPLISDSEGYLVQNQVCKPYTNCYQLGRYMVSRGADTEDQDNVCATPTQCISGEEYESVPLVMHQDAVGSDRKCSPLSRCDSTTQYLSKMGGDKSDNICNQKTDCYALMGGLGYEKSPSLDATTVGAVGRDSTCANYTRCPPGHYANFTGDPRTDRQCAPCPAGTYGTDGNLCTRCPTGSFIVREGSTSCDTCSKCDSASPPIAAEWSACSPGEECVPGVQQMCTPTSDTTCMSCSLKSWNFNNDTGACEPCSNGYHYASDNHAGVVSGSLKRSQRCLPCNSNFYCPSKDTFEACQGLRVFEIPSKGHAFVPTSLPGSSLASDCTCNSFGGFEGSADGLVGCMPCKDGYFSGPGDASCAACPPGKYSSARVVTDLFACPTASSPRILFMGQPSGYAGWVWPSSATPAAAECNTAVGATRCESCPPDKPNTKSSSSTSASDCSRCGDEEFWDGSLRQCFPCAECLPPEEGGFEILGCSDETNRVCGTCTQTVCPVGETFSRCTKENPTGCTPCTNAPSGALYVSSEAPGAAECAWRCMEGFFTYDYQTCQECTLFDARTCPAGKFLSACTSTRDASCDLFCDESIRPLLNSEWVRATQGLVESADENAPSEGCLWKCTRGHVKITTDSGIDLCVLEGGPLASRYGAL